jgi:serine/threonine-protein kinase
MNDELERRIRAFEQSWRCDGPSDIQSELDREPKLTADERHWLLVEFICIDLEFRWRNSQHGGRASDAPILELYHAQFPELGCWEQLPIELIGQEYRVRRQFGNRPTHSEYFTRFHERHSLIEAELERVDRELEDEASEPRLLVDRTRAAPAVDSQATSDLRLLAHADFLLRRMIGAGRTGKVYEAWQHSTQRIVAVKFLRKGLLHHQGIVGRFIREARIVAKLQHPHIVGLHRFGRTPAGAYFIVMEYVEGSNLEEGGRSEPISVENAIRWTIALCHAVEHAHENGIIHCDLKPANLLVGIDGMLRVTDFGLARSLNDPAAWTAEVEGTAPFMAPEQISAAWGEIDVRTDVYGVGAVLYTLLTARPPWPGRRVADIMADVVSAAPVVPLDRLRADLPSSIATVCLRCLAKNPDDRFTSVGEIRRALSEVGVVR